MFSWPFPHLSFVFKQPCDFSPFQMSNLENHNPQVIRQISKEVKTLSSEQLEGIKISINESNLTDIQATIEGPGRKRIVIRFKSCSRSAKSVDADAKFFPNCALSIDPIFPLRIFNFSLPPSIFVVIFQLEHPTLADSFAFNSHYLKISRRIHLKLTS